ncbi:MAG: transglycosylase SLT domain-containing protein [Prochloron sp. SP5CPC1]|nr:transglycosylase SLT domain-containing protein [Candidatus Paraprochloron terpiosi SP5CPC1]
MNKGRIFTFFLIILAILGSTLLTPRVFLWLEELRSPSTGEVTPLEGEQAAEVLLSLTPLPAKTRAAKLEEIAQQPPSLVRNRARYLLAVDLIKQKQGKKALFWLDSLEKDYPVLGAHILLQRAKAYGLISQKNKERGTLKKLIQKYPNSPVGAEVLYMLGEKTQAIAEFPHHPLTHLLINQELEKNPNQPPLLLLLAEYAADAPGMNQVRDKLVAEYESELKPEDWQVIADGYWQVGRYKKAAVAYGKAPITAENLYRIARGAHLNNEPTAAINGYQKLLATFKDAQENGRVLLHLASLSQDKEALDYLERVKEFEDFAPIALLETAKRWERLNNPEKAQATLQFLLQNYPNSDAAARWRWSAASKAAAQEDFLAAWELAQPITETNSSLAAEAAFWIGKWAQKLDRPEEAKASFEYLLARHPQSYYSWRAATILGQEVGDFTTVRKIMPTGIKPPGRLPLLAGSPALQELYLLGQDQDAAILWQAEIGGRRPLTVAEQYSEGLLLLARGDYQLGINRVWSLSQREAPQDKQEWKALRETPEYWQALFPLPYYETIQKWSQERKLNPLLVAALIRQESRFEKESRSPAGAIGLMQVIPDTAKWVAEKIGLKNYTLINPDDNINLGTWYFDYTHQEYENNSLLAIASYNAGPGNVKKWVEKYGYDDPDLFVENIPFPETRDYVKSVLGNYWNYLGTYGQ